LETKRFAHQKTTWETKKAVLEAAAGAHSRGKPVVEWGADGHGGGTSGCWEAKKSNHSNSYVGF
jgi:hypothetical protein